MSVDIVDMVEQLERLEEAGVHATGEEIGEQALRALAAHDLLTAADEVRLAGEVKAGRLATERLVEAGDDLGAQERQRLALDIERGDAARDRLVRQNVRLIVSIARRYLNRGLPLEDLVQEGVVGLMKAVERYDPGLGFRFSTYATWWVRQAISRALIEQGRSVRLPEHMVTFLGRVRRETVALEQRLGRLPTVAELAEALAAEPTKVREALSASLLPTSLDAPLGEEGGTLAEVVADTQTPVATAAEATELGRALREALDRLTARQRHVLILRHGLDGQPARTLAEIGAELGISRERARQLEAQALSVLGREHPELESFVA